jgi:hypothetical protein
VVPSGSTNTWVDWAGTVAAWASVSDIVGIGGA